MGSLEVETPSDDGAWDAASPPTNVHRIRTEKSSRTRKSASGTPDADASPSASPSPPELKFVTTTGPPSERSKESRLVVRSHAMQAFLREKKSVGKGAIKKEPEVQVKSIDDAIGRFKLSSWSRKSSKRAIAIRDEKARNQGGGYPAARVSSKRPRTLVPVPSPQSILGQLDPFGIIPIALTPRTQSLLLHYTTAFTMNSAAVNPEGSWLSFALTDAALLHATLSLVAYHFDITHGRDESLDCLYQKGEAIKKMNQRLGDSHQQFRDTTIATVSLFANIEVYTVSTEGPYDTLTEEKSMSGTRPISDVHMTALEGMVNARGGLENFSHNKVLQRVLTWADIIYAATWNYPPRFPLLQSYNNDDYTGSLERFSSIYDPYLQEYDSYSWCQSSPIMYDVLEMLRRVSAAMASPDITDAERGAVSNRIYVLEHNLLSSRTATEIQDYDISYDIYEADISEPFRIAALLYAHLVLRELPHTAKMHSKLVANLKFILEQQATTLAYTTSRQTLELLAWIFFMGGAAAADAGERQYFITLLVRVCSGLGLEGSNEIKATLMGVMWLEKICGGYFSRIWKEMTLL